MKPAPGLLSLVAVVLASGCNETIEQKIASAFKLVVTQQLKNPSSAEFGNIVVKKVTLPNLRHLGGGSNGYYVYAKVRGTNSFGGVVPQNFQGFFNSNGEPIFVGTPENTHWGDTLDELDEADRWMDQYLPE